jgi:hypothetical protein
MKYLAIIILSFVCFSCNSNSPPTPPLQEDNYSISILSDGLASDIIIKPYYPDSIVINFNYTQPDSFYSYESSRVKDNSVTFLSGHKSRPFTITNLKADDFFNSWYSITAITRQCYDGSCDFTGPEIFKFHINKN